ncbi:ribosome small subunit-dependent GTPase A [Lactiplantibacillus nangangensis]|uniref:Small ribosomal subunit biogenesis GTPase RsgA n=1 Tax=Lactiplantibacillus nangangensis TaxID=2559917 RepID=A0ABW1SNI8_9LACO|nr:ribosome small subunit-dependent GTPase A [Lactiplantibacillus nangangensis]
MTINLIDYGLTTALNTQAAVFEGLVLGRVTAQHRNLYQVVTTAGDCQATVAGKFSYEKMAATDFPAVGDWVMLTPSTDTAVIQHLLPRQSVLAREAVGNSSAGQVIAANIDTIFICMSLNANFNVRRIERYLTMAWDSQAMPVIVLTKADLCDDLPEKLSALSAVSFGVDVVTCSAKTGVGYEDVAKYVTAGKTVAFIGSSGVGKSTLINHLLGRELLATKTIRADDDKGRHATTSRQLLRVPQGGMVIDTPGMRELQLYTGDLDRTFADIAALAMQCKFRDCTHTSEPGCAVQAALKSGTLSQDRLASYQKLQREMAYDGLTSRQRETEKVNRLFGGKNEMKQVIRQAKAKQRRR